MHGVGCNTLQPTQIKMLQSTPKQRIERLVDFLFDSVVLKESGVRHRHKETKTDRQTETEAYFMRENTYVIL